MSFPCFLRRKWKYEISLFVYIKAISLLNMVLGGVSDQVPVFDQPIRKKDAQAMFAV